MSDDVNHDDLDDVARIEALLAELELDDLEPIEPPPELWAKIESRLAESTPATAESATVRSIDDVRRRRNLAWIGAAAAIVLVAAGAVVMLSRDTSDNVVSEADLTFDPAAFDPRGAEATAAAQLLDLDGSYSIRLTDTSFPELDGDDLELWLIEPDEEGNPVDVVPVSLVDPDGDGTYDVPDEIDPSTHFVVDISIEPRDGDATHSGQSILRGALEPA